MSNEYLPLAEHLKGEGLKEGTVLESTWGGGIRGTWNGRTVEGLAGLSVSPRDSLDIDWRIVSTPPKKITFETELRFGRFTSVGEDLFNMPDGPVIVTVEKR